MSDDATTTKAATADDLDARLVELLEVLRISGMSYELEAADAIDNLLALLRAERAARAAAEGERKAWAKSIYGIVSFVGDEPRLLTEKQVVRLREIADGLLSAAGDTEEAP